MCSTPFSFKFLLRDFPRCQVGHGFQLTEDPGDFVDGQILLQVFFQGPGVHGFPFPDRVEAASGLAPELVGMPMTAASSMPG